MRSTRLQVSVLAGVLLACVALTSVQGDERKMEPKKAGAVVGVVAAKGVGWVQIKADGELKARRYVANWVGGAPRDGGGPDKEIVKVIKGLKLGSRVRLMWEFDERPRIVKVELLEGAAAKGTLEKNETKPPVKKGRPTGRLPANPAGWWTNYQAARAAARKSGKPLFVVFRCQP